MVGQAAPRSAPSPAAAPGQKWTGDLDGLRERRMIRVLVVVGRETVQYVSNIYKYCIACQLAMQEREERHKAIDSLRPRPPK